MTILTILEDENNKFREECEELKSKNAALVRRVNELRAPRDHRFHPAIVVQFARRSVRGEWLAAHVSRRRTYNAGPVFVIEHLTLQTKDLLWRCKTRVKDGSLAYAWCKDGKVFVRHTEKSRAIRVYRSVEEIDREQSPGHGK
ncbi:hypothetical protein J6590_019183 [Homalodisca vitripennis]|nr:hypothetical protein J6590_019183 [Homalodisca vitripennis]